MHTPSEERSSVRALGPGVHSCSELLRSRGRAAVSPVCPGTSRFESMRAFTRGKDSERRSDERSAPHEAMGDSGEVVSGPRKMTQATEARAEVDKELIEIRKEVIESRNLVIKTDNLLKSLHAEVKGFGKRQEDFERRQWLSSSVAYLLFVVLTATAALVVSAVRGSVAKGENVRLQKAIDQLTATREKEHGDLQLAQATSRGAAEAYRQMTTASGDDRLKGAEAIAKLDLSRLTPLEKQALTDRSEALRNEIGQAALDRGKAAFRKNDMKTAIQELERFLSMNPPESDSVEASYYLGVAYSVSKQHQQAVAQLARFVAQDKKAKSRDYAMLLLAHSYEQIGELEKAAQIAREALSTYPHSDFSTQFRTRLRAVQRGMAGGAGAGMAPSAGKAPAARNEADAAAAGEATGR